MENEGRVENEENQKRVSHRFPQPLEIATRFPHSHRADGLSMLTKRTKKQKGARYCARFIFSPSGSSLNIVETLFGKMARSFLRHIRVQSLDELKARILKGIAEINAAPVVHQWKNSRLSNRNNMSHLQN